MPNWGSHIPDVLRLATRWLTIGEISSRCSTRWMDIRAESSGSRPTRALRPSSPCVKNHLIRMIESRQVIGLRGARGANWFATIDHALNIASFPNAPRLTGQYREARRQREWNAETLAAARIDGHSIPLPWSETVSRASDQARSGRQPVSGPLQEEAIRILRNFCPADNSYEYDVGRLLERIQIRSGRPLGHEIPTELRPHVTMEDISEIMAEVLDKVLQKARSRSQTAPRTLEDEFYSRLEQLAEDNDG